MLTNCHKDESAERQFERENAPYIKPQHDHRLQF